MSELFHQIVLYGCKLNVVVLEDFESNKSAVYNVLGETNVGGFTISKGFQEYVISYLFKIHYNNYLLDEFISLFQPMTSN